MKRKKREEKPAGPFPPCAVPGCPDPGEYKAPLSRELTDKYQYLCLDHVREFNRAWDYFDGWNRDAIEGFMHDSAFGHRPTWKLGLGPVFTSDALRDSFFKMLGEAPPKAARRETKTERKEREALAALDLEPGAAIAAIKAQYKKLVKKYHPDVNKSAAAEETFKRITVAYTSILKSYGEK